MQEGLQTKAAPLSIRQRRLANKWRLVATDESITLGMGKTGLTEFVVRCPTQPLSDDMVRHFVDVSQLPKELQFVAELHGRLRRAVVDIKSTGERHLEICWGSRPSLHMCVDMGSIGFNGKQHIGRCADLRCTLDIDASHRRHDNYLWSLARSGLSWTKLEMQLLESFTSSPFSNSSNFHALVGAAEEFFANKEITKELFLWHYPHITWEMFAGQMPSSFGTKNHEEHVWQRTNECWTFQRKGTRTKAARWWQPHNQTREHATTMAMEAMLLDYIGMHEDWDLEEPAATTTKNGPASASATDPTAHADAAAPAVPARVPTKRSDDAARALLHKCKTTSTPPSAFAATSFYIRFGGTCIPSTTLWRRSTPRLSCIRKHRRGQGNG